MEREEVFIMNRPVSIGGQKTIGQSFLWEKGKKVLSIANLMVSTYHFCV
jgi:hypothetical protein